jgi:hypothetical protein
MAKAVRTEGAAAEEERPARVRVTESEGHGGAS